jgi:hypothetical protein
LPSYPSTLVAATTFVSNFRSCSCTRCVQFFSYRTLRRSETYGRWPLSDSFLILSSHLGLGFPSGLFPSGFLIKTLYAFLFSSHVCYISCPEFEKLWSYSNGWRSINKYKGSLHSDKELFQYSKCRIVFIYPAARIVPTKCDVRAGSCYVWGAQCCTVHIWVVYN